MTVSAVIPIYNVSGYIERCARSLFSQSLDNIEYIFVNDATTDNSIDILRSVLDEIPHRKHQVRIVEHDVNKGLPAARNTGIALASGDYLFNCDSDDFLESDMLRLMLDEAVRTDADLVWCDWFLTFGSNERTMSQPAASTPRQALADMLNGSMKYNVWNKLVRRSLFIDHNIHFPSGYAMGEDMTMIRIAAKARKVAYVPRPLYHYIRVNTGAMTQQYTPARLDALRHNVQLTVDFLHDNIHDASIEKEISWFLLNTKLPFLFTGSKHDISLWLQWYPQANRHILSNKSQSLRTRFLQLCAAHHLGLVNRLYYNLVFNVFYGKIFK